MYIIIAQIIGILGMLMNVLSYQRRKKRDIIIMQLFGSIFFSVNMFMLNAMMGGLLNLIGIFRAVVYSNREKLRGIKIWNTVFIALYALSYVVVFTLLAKPVTPFNLICELLPLVGMIATTLSFATTSASLVRKFALISSPAWLIYNCLNFALGGIICEVMSLISVAISIYRFDRQCRR